MAWSCFRRSVIRSALLAFIATGAWLGSWPCAATAQTPYPNRSSMGVSGLVALGMKIEIVAYAVIA